MNCDRCKKATSVYSYSMFNMDRICPDCKCKEENHPKYKFACNEIRREYNNGNPNFVGIGKPEDL